MTIKERTKLIQPIADELGLAQHRDVAYKIIEHDGFKIILCLLFDRVSDKDKFRPYFFGQTLFIPLEHLNLSFGNTITHPLENPMPYCRNTDYWDVDSYTKYKSLICAKVTDFMNTVKSFQSFMNALVKRKYPYFSNHTHEAEICAYINVILKRKKDALSYLKIVSEQPNPMNLNYIEEERQRAVTLSTLLATDNYDVIYEQLLQWQNKTITALGLKF